MAIGSEPEIGTTFRIGTRDIHYPWIVDGVVQFLMHGDSDLVFVRGRKNNIYPPAHYTWKFSNGGVVSNESEVTNEVDGVQD